MKKVTGILSGTRILCRDKSTIEKYIFLGDEAKKLGGFSVIEGLYLIEKGTLEVYDKNRIINFATLLEKGKNLTRDENFYIKYVVFRDLMSKGYMPATGFKFGVDFRVYDKKEEIKTAKTYEKNEKNISYSSNGMHSNFLIKVVPEEYISSFPGIAGDIRLAKAVNKNLIYAVVDKDSDILYYGIDIAKI